MAPLNCCWWHSPPKTPPVRVCIVDDVKLAELSVNSFWMKERDILEGQNILWPILHIFRGQDPNPRDLRYAPLTITSYVI